MAISYKKLFKLLIDRDLKKKDLKDMTGISYATLHKLERGENIYDEVIQAIRHKKSDIQFLFATHNANIPVLGDAEKIVVADYREGIITTTQGNIDFPETHKMIVDIMEGGQEAFRRRQLIYTAWK